MIQTPIQAWRDEVLSAANSESEDSAQRAGLLHALEITKDRGFNGVLPTLSLALVQGTGEAFDGVIAALRIGIRIQEELDCVTAEAAE